MAQATANTETARIREDADALLSLLDEVVPHTTIHYAVEGARRALRTLSREADTIHTNETKEV